MRVKLKDLCSPDIPDLKNWSANETQFGFLLDAMIGPSDSDGEETFSLTVCTVGWFHVHQMKGSAIRSGVHTLFVTDYDYRTLWTFIERAVNRVEADSWRGLAEKL